MTTPDTDATGSRTDAIGSRTATRRRIVDAAAQLLHDQGVSAVTTRGVAEAAGVQAPTIYRLLGDKDGLLDAVAEHVMTLHATAKSATVARASADGVDPVEELRAGWDGQIAFGLAEPDVFRLLSDPDRVRHSPAARIGIEVLVTRIRRVAAAGRLRVGEDRALALVQAAGVGTVQTLLATEPDRRDPGLPDAMWAAVAAQVLTDAPPPAQGGRLAAALAVRATAPDLEVLSEGERRLLVEWLDRVVASGDGRGAAGAGGARAGGRDGAGPGAAPKR